MKLTSFVFIGHAFGLICIGLVSCMPPPKELATAETKAPIILPEGSPTLSVCDAAKQPVDARIQISGSFGGFGYATDSKVITLESDEICNDQGGGLVFATLLNDVEVKKLFQTRPGTKIIIEGTIERIEKGRFVHLKQVIIKSIANDKPSLASKM